MERGRELKEEREENERRDSGKENVCVYMKVCMSVSI